METKLLIPPLTIGEKTDSKELIVRPEYEIVDFDEQRRWFFKVTGVTTLICSYMVFSPQSLNANPALARIVILILIKLRESLGQGSDKLPKCTGCGECLEAWNGSENENSVNAEEVAESCPENCFYDAL